MRTWLQGWLRLARFAAMATFRLPWVATQPALFLPAFYQALVPALALATACGAATGVVVWIHVRESLVRVAGPGAAIYIPQGLALAVLLELAPLTAGLLTSGRSGASLAAELGAMRNSEQIDALEVLGQSPVGWLVAPRVLAHMLALPLLTGVLAVVALAAGAAAEALGGSLTWQRYWIEVGRVMDWRDVLPAHLKTVVFGWLVAVIGCYNGIYVDGGTEGVGRAATRGVVQSILAVVLVNVVLVRLIQILQAA